jgi:hypothetical protein
LLGRYSFCMGHSTSTSVMPFNRYHVISPSLQWLIESCYPFLQMTCLHVLFNIERIHPIPRLIQETVEILVIQICVSIGAGCILSCSLAFCRFLHLGPIHFCKIYYKVFGSLKFFITLCFSCAFSQELKTEIIIFTQSWLCSWRSSYEYRNHTSLSQKEIELVKIGYHRAERTGQKL